MTAVSQKSENLPSDFTSSTLRHFRFSDPHNPIWKEAWSNELRVWEFETGGGHYAKVTCRYREEEQLKERVYSMKGVVVNSHGQAVDCSWNGNGEHPILSRWDLSKPWKKREKVTKYINILSFDKFTGQFVSSSTVFDTPEKARLSFPLNGVCAAVPVTFEA